MLRLIIVLLFVLVSCATQMKTVESERKEMEKIHKEERRTKEDLCKFGDKYVENEVLDLLCK